MAIHLINESDSRFGIFVRAGDDAVPDVWRIDHSRAWRLFNRAVGKICGLESLLVWESHRRAIQPAIDRVLSVTHRIVDRISPRLAGKLELEPFVVIHRLQELVSDVDRDIKIG